MDHSKQMRSPSARWSAGNPSTNQPSAPPPFRDRSFPLSSTEPQGYGLSQPHWGPLPAPNQQPFGSPFQHPNQQPFSMGQPQPGQPGVFIVQPILQNHQAGPINDYFCYSIFTMLFCCLPLGIAALVSSIATRNAIARRDWQMAVQSSRRALMLNHIALGMGISFIAIINVVIVIMYII